MHAPSLAPYVPTRGHDQLSALAVARLQNPSPSGLCTPDSGFWICTRRHDVIITRERAERAGTGDDRDDREDVHFRWRCHRASAKSRRSCWLLHGGCRRGPWCAQPSRPCGSTMFGATTDVVPTVELLLERTGAMPLVEKLLATLPPMDNMLLITERTSCVVCKAKGCLKPMLKVDRSLEHASTNIPLYTTTGVRTVELCLKQCDVCKAKHGLSYVCGVARCSQPASSCHTKEPRARAIFTPRNLRCGKRACCATLRHRRSTRSRASPHSCRSTGSSIERCRARQIALGARLSMPGWRGGVQLGLSTVLCLSCTASLWD